MNVRTFRPALTTAQLRAQVAALDRVLAEARAYAARPRDHLAAFDAQLASKQTGCRVSFGPMLAQELTK